MKKKILSILSALLIAILITSTAAAGAIKLTVKFSLSSGGTSSTSIYASALGGTNSFDSLTASGYASGLGNMDVTIGLDASGDASIICTNNGSNAVLGQSSPKVSASGQQTLFGNDPVRKNGRSPFEAKTVNPPTVAWNVGGCPNSNWTAQITYIKWTNATISVEDTATGMPLIEPQKYNCTTTPETHSVTCEMAK
jgi:hypothetical protein